LTDLGAYYGFTEQMHAAVVSAHPRLAVRLVTVSNAAASNRTQADFDGAGRVLTADATRINAQAMTQASGGEQPATYAQATGQSATPRRGHDPLPRLAFYLFAGFYQLVHAMWSA
jgi:hypothetical protein